jgi:hypothetical protein
MLAVHLDREIPLPHRPEGFALLRLLVGRGPLPASGDGQGIRARRATKRVEGLGGISAAGLGRTAAAVVVISRPANRNIK